MGEATVFKGFRPFYLIQMYFPMGWEHISLKKPSWDSTNFAKGVAKKGGHF